MMSPSLLSFCLTGRRAAPVSLLQAYQEQISEGRIRFDAEQQEALQHLQNLMEEITGSTRWPRFRRPKPRLLGVYLYGDVGRGKSMLMDLFWRHCPIQAKRRVHFHAFMLEIHDFMHRNRKSRLKDPIAHFAEQLHRQTQVLCFDEFHVIDVANAMILKRLFTRLWDLGTVIVSTSNRHPDTLYQGGFHPELFQPFIDFLKNACRVVELRGGRDYRRHHRANHDFWLCPPAQANARLLDHYRRLSGGRPPIEPTATSVYGRQLPLTASTHRIALADFQLLCGQPLGPADYKALALRHDALLLSDVPRFGPDNLDAGKRFSTLIDALYFYRVILIASAEAEIDQLCLPGARAFYLKRTISRLQEMQSKDYYRQTRLGQDH